MTRLLLLLAIALASSCEAFTPSSYSAQSVSSCSWLIELFTAAAVGYWERQQCEQASRYKSGTHSTLL